MLLLSYFVITAIYRIYVVFDVYYHLCWHYVRWPGIMCAVYYAWPIISTARHYAAYGMCYALRLHWRMPMLATAYVIVINAFRHAAYVAIYYAAAWHCCYYICCYYIMLCPFACMAVAILFVTSLTYTCCCLLCMACRMYCGIIVLCGSQRHTVALRGSGVWNVAMTYAALTPCCICACCMFVVCPTYMFVVTLLLLLTYCYALASLCVADNNHVYIICHLCHWYPLTLHCCDAVICVIFMLTYVHLCGVCGMFTYCVLTWTA